ncbi:uncharacterized protein LOC115921815 [Strongylocentrotus purpuratus]|uniref:Reverse transcriptase domain-containing protein n=1 Tax=Strongylocentrotus purpuratus TaxID=7668 RepID=A0A7M7SWA8_STRPU|nr:uncharacterized protein LOC115921815 [Strongylocentrotus purpuratus]
MVPKRHQGLAPMREYRALIVSPCLTAIPSPISRMLHPILQDVQSSARSTWYVRTTRYLSNLQMCTNRNHYPFRSLRVRRMPFGLQNAAQTFQRFMDKVVRGPSFVYVYMDDILVASKLSEQHEEHLRLLFNRYSATEL